MTELTDHMIRETAAAYKGTDREADFLIHHDALFVFTAEKEAQDYIKSQYPEMAGRFIASVGTTNQGTAYHGRAPGDSPELARGLDSHGFFADLDYATSYCCSLASAFRVQMAVTGDFLKKMSAISPPESLLRIFRFLVVFLIFHHAPPCTAVSWLP